MEIFCVNNIKHMISKEEELNNNGLYSYVSSIKILSNGSEEEVQIVEVEKINSEDKINKYRHCNNTKLMLPLLKDMKTHILMRDIKHKIKEIVLLFINIIIIIKYFFISIF